MRKRARSNATESANAGGEVDMLELGGGCARRGETRRGRRVAVRSVFSLMGEGHSRCRSPRRLDSQMGVGVGEGQTNCACRLNVGLLVSHVIRHLTGCICDITSL